MTENEQEPTPLERDARKAAGHARDVEATIAGVAVWFVLAHFIHAPTWAAVLAGIVSAGMMKAR